MVWQTLSCCGVDGLHAKERKEAHSVFSKARICSVRPNLRSVFLSTGLTKFIFILVLSLIWIGGPILIVVEVSSFGVLSACRRLN